MSIDTKEIIAIAEKKQLNSVKDFTKKLLDETLNNDIGYVLVCLDLIINNRERGEYSAIIKKKKDIETIDQIQDFEMLSLYQNNVEVNDHISIQKEDNLYYFLAKYMGPSINYNNTFDFALEIDSAGKPKFSNKTKNQPLKCNKIIELINNGKEDHKYENIDDISDNNLEKFIFEKLTNKNAIWGGKETKNFKEWKEQVSDLYKEETGKYNYYSGTLTKGFAKYLRRMYRMWKISLNKQINSHDIEKIKRFLSFLKLQ